MSETFHYYDAGALLERLSTGIRRRNQEVVFLVGSPFSAPTHSGAPGVPGVGGVIDLIRREFEDDSAQAAALESALGSSNPYQSGFVFLQGRRGQLTANEIVRKAVASARTGTAPILEMGPSSYAAIDDACRQMEFDNGGWALSPATEALGKLATSYSAHFGRSLLTTNFDPLIEVSIERAGGSYFRTMLHADGNLSQTEGSGCHVIHLHGYWYGSDTLHTARQLGQARPRLRASLASLLRDKLVVVCGYGGWDDAFTEALMDVVRDDTAHPEILWTFYHDKPVLSEQLQQRLTAGSDRGRLSLYSGIDCHSFLPQLYGAWSSITPAAVRPLVVQSNPVHVPPTIIQLLDAQTVRQAILEGDDEDRPPLVDIFVGRERELQMVRESAANVIFLTGLGGQGKSTVAARYFSDCQIRNPGFSFFVWRDCKEESERFENQLSSIIEKLTGGQVSGQDLAKQSSKALVAILTGLISHIQVLFVFDNCDHYVNLETRRLVGSADFLTEALVGSASRSRVVFTCRPSVSYDSLDVLNCPLEGLTLGACQSLFNERGAAAAPDQINDAHQLTDGHAFWLDLLAIQSAKRSPGRDLAILLNEIRSGSGPIPERTLTSIWTTLNDRERTVLRTMAETLKPETELEISDYVQGTLNFNKVTKALRALRSLNLVVIKPRPNGPDFLELHPLVRQFLRGSFPPVERATFIDAIISVYKRYIKSHESQLSERPTLSILQYWTQNAELDIAAGRFDDAVLTLSEVAIVFEFSGYTREYVRVARLLLGSLDWVAEHANLKGLDLILTTHLRNLSHLGEITEADSLLDLYEKTVSDRDARYIQYCEMRCYSYWFRGNFEMAIAWGIIGRDLKESSGVDTMYSVAHTLALAERDAGRPESALPVFLEGRSLTEVVEPEELDEVRHGHYYGNIGRCLHYMGQIDSALVCYQKSALLIERDPIRENVAHQAYIRTWIGELLEARKQFKLAYVFFRAAHRKWEVISPQQAIRTRLRSEQLETRYADYRDLTDLTVEKICRNWILGRSMDARL
jgi:tetratricopeptide (TPR) repeat protein